MTSTYINVADHPIAEADYIDRCRTTLDDRGALVLTGFFTETAIARIVAQSAPREGDAFYAGSTHNVYLTDPDPERGVDHPFNRQVTSSKGLIADDQIPPDSPLRAIYDDPTFRIFIAEVVGVAAIHPYADPLSSINVHFAAAGMELGWHFDNSSFAVTMLLQAPDGGGSFDYVPDVRGNRPAHPAGGSVAEDVGDTAGEHLDPAVGRLDDPASSAEFQRVADVLDGRTAVSTLVFAPGDLVLFRGRNALHRVTPTEGPTTRLLAVLAFNDEPGFSLSASAMATFYGRTA
ncbi:MAG: 2OG-Fe(II) oxygenase [Actinomycetota bacterium]